MMMVSFFSVFLSFLINRYHFFSILIMVEFLLLFGVFGLVCSGMSYWYFVIFFLVFGVIESCLGLSLMVFISRVSGLGAESVMGSYD